jgi:hypothetical protein
MSLYRRTALTHSMHAQSLATELLFKETLSAEVSTRRAQEQTAKTDALIAYISALSTSHLENVYSSYQAVDDYGAGPNVGEDLLDPDDYP